MLSKRARARASHLSYYRRWQAQHVAEAAVMVPKGWRWSVSGYYWVPARKVTP